MEIKVYANKIKSSPKKTRLVTNLVNGMKAETALAQLQFLNKEVAKDILHLLKSAISAAKDKDIDVSNLVISKIFCNDGFALKRRLIIERGKSSEIKKRSSRVTLILSEINPINNK